MHTVKRLLFFCFILFLMFAEIGCESTFDPLKKNEDIVFSMFGTLDLHADTQWVRVMPLGETLLPTDTTISKTEVTLTRLETGETTTLNDSVFTFRNNTIVRNYWTTTSLHSQEEYILEAEAPDGRTSRAAVTIPGPISRPLIDYNVMSNEGLVIVQTDDSLVVANSKFKVQLLSEFGPGPIEEMEFSHLDHLHRNNGGYRFKIEGKRLINTETSSRYKILNKEVVLAVGSKDWPDLSDLTEEEIPIPDQATSNVENGIGVVAGVASRTAPLESCYNENEELIPCGEEN